MFEPYIEHHGILGQKWGIRRYQNPDGSLTAEGRARLERKIQKKDTRWAKRNYNKIYKKAYKSAKKDMNTYVKKDLNKQMSPYNKSGGISLTYANAYNKKLAELMNEHVSELPTAPSGRVVNFIAKRGDIGVHMALVDEGYDMSGFKSGVYGSGRVAYKNKTVNKLEI